MDHEQIWGALIVLSGLTVSLRANSVNLQNDRQYFNTEQPADRKKRERIGRKILYNRDKSFSHEWNDTQVTSKFQLFHQILMEHSIFVKPPKTSKLRKIQRVRVKSNHVLFLLMVTFLLLYVRDHARLIEVEMIIVMLMMMPTWSRLRRPWRLTRRRRPLRTTRWWWRGEGGGWRSCARSLTLRRGSSTRPSFTGGNI